MILQSLLRYYEILADDPESGIARPGWAYVKVSLIASLSPEGELLGLIPCKIQQQRGKKLAEVPQLMLMPEPAKKTAGVHANFLCENTEYVFGLDTKGRPERTRRCFEAFREKHLRLLGPLEVPEARAICRFVSRWNPDTAAQHPLLQSSLDDLAAGANIAFQLEGGRLLHKVPEIQAAWEADREAGSSTVRGQCLVSGELRPIARLHPSIKGVQGAQAVGASIVSFNARAYESYGRENGQGLNAPVSEYAAFAYTTVLNRLLADSAYRMRLGDATVVYWAEAPGTAYQEVSQLFMNPPMDEGGTNAVQDTATESMIGRAIGKVASGLPVASAFHLDPNVQFCILALSPNSARLSVRFFLRDSFGNFLERITAHYRDLQLAHAPFEPEVFPPWKLLAETVSPTSRDKSASPLLSGAVMRAILTGSPYPESLASAIHLRIRAEHEVSYYKAAILKACLLRKRLKPSDREVLTVSLNEQSTNKAYVLGRLFSVLEKLQQEAHSDPKGKVELNSSIRDRYFTSACASPSSVFSILLCLSNTHISKSKYGKIRSIQIENLLGKLNVNDDPFPAQLSLDDQGIFILGYYHQKSANYAKSEKKEEEQQL